MDNVISDTMQSYNNYINNLVLECTNIANDFREGNIEKSLDQIVLLSQGISWLVEANKLLSQNNYTISLKIDDISGFLNEINSALLEKDYLLVADIIEYEIKSFFEVVELYDIKLINRG